MPTLPDLADALSMRYRIERELGAGGMATVFLAEDVRHRRRVALKVLHPELSAVLGGERFLKEIELTANLQHPHILPLFDSGEAAGQLFYVMPFVEGETLRGRLEREKQLPIEDALRIAREIADALQYAHERGVIHRDIKPENILLQGGHALVADFGIALAVHQAGGTRMTQTGLSLGTPQYMAPEQAMGERTIDARADIYALGAVTYEMLAGEAPFTGPTAQAIVARVLTTQPAPVTQTRNTVPANVEHAVHAALAKLPADRPASAAAFMNALSAAAPSQPHVTRGDRGHVPVPGRRPWIIALFGAATVGAFFIGQAISSRGGTSEVATFTSLVPADGETWLNVAGRAGFALSPDGRRVAIRARTSDWNGLLVRSLDSLTSVHLPNTRDARDPFWSPDGDTLGFFADGQLKVLELSSGSVRSVCPASSPEGASWSGTGVILYAPEFGGRIHRTTVGGRECAPLVFDNPPVGRVRPYWLSDDRHFVLAINNGALIGTVGTTRLDTLARLDQTSQQPVVASGDYLLYTPQGAEGQSFHAQRINVRAERLEGPVFPLLRRVEGGVARTAMSASRSGSLLAALGGTGRAGTIGRFGAGVLRDSVNTNVAGFFYRPRVTPDGRQLVIGGFRMSTMDWRRGVLNDLLPLRTPRVATTYLVWLPGDTAVAFARRDTIVLMNTQTRRDQLLFIDTVGSRSVELSDWSADGTYLAYIYTAGADAAVNEPWMFDVAAGTHRRMFSDDMPVYEIRFSPDGRYVAYERVAPEGPAVYVRALPDGAPVRVIPGNASSPRWGPRGASLFFRRGDRIEEV